MKTTKLNYGGKMSKEFNKTTPNIRLPRQDSEADFGKTVTSVYVPESEYQYQTPQPTQPPQQQYQQQPPRQTQGGVPGWVWALVGVGAFFFLALAVVVVVIILMRTPGFIVVVKNAPPNSKVFVDDTERGTTNSKGEITVRDLEAGNRTIRITSDCYNDYVERVEGNDGDVKDVTPKMARKPSCGGDGDLNKNRNGNANNNNRGNGKTSREQIRDDLKNKGRVSVYGINFDFNKADLRPDSKPVLENIIAVLKEDFPNMKVLIEGHTDNKGSAQYNQKLSERRAKAVKDYLTFSGIEANRLTSVGRGLSDPKVSNDTDEGRATNRRVELVRQ